MVPNASPVVCYIVQDQWGGCDSYHDGQLWSSCEDSTPFLCFVAVTDFADVHGVEV